MTGQKRHRDTAEIVKWAGSAIRAAGNCIRLRGFETDEDLSSLAALKAAVDDALVHAVAGARDKGYSWQEIADNLGVTRQTAHEKYATLVVEQPDLNEISRASVVRAS